MSAPFETRKSIVINRELRRTLGLPYSWDGDELYYFGNPLSDHWQTEHERTAVLRAHRLWHEATTAN